MSTVTITGLSATRQALEQLPLKVEKRILRKGIREGAKVMLSAARADAPSLSGATRRNVKIRGGRSKPGTIGLSVGVAAKDFAGPTFYAGFVIYGHRIGKRALGDRRKLVPADNFLSRAYEETKDEAVAVTAAKWAELVKTELK